MFYKKQMNSSTKNGADLLPEVVKHQNYTNNDFFNLYV